MDARACVAASTRIVAAVCEQPTPAFECSPATPRDDDAGCPFALRSPVALQHEPAVEACIRMGYWWARSYRASCIDPPGDNRYETQQQLIEAASGEPPPGAPLNWAAAQNGGARLRTFTNTTGLWPLRLVGATPLAASQIGVLPSDSYRSVHTTHTSHTRLIPDSYQIIPDAYQTHTGSFPTNISGGFRALRGCWWRALRHTRAAPHTTGRRRWARAFCGRD